MAQRVSVDVWVWRSDWDGVSSEEKPQGPTDGGSVREGRNDGTAGSKR